MLSMLVASLHHLPAVLIFSVIDKSFDYFFNRCFILLDPDKYYIPFSDYRK